MLQLPFSSIGALNSAVLPFASVAVTVTRSPFLGRVIVSSAVTRPRKFIVLEGLFMLLLYVALSTGKVTGSVLKDESRFPLKVTFEVGLVGRYKNSGRRILPWEPMSPTSRSVVSDPKVYACVTAAVLFTLPKASIAP